MLFDPNRVLVVLTFCLCSLPLLFIGCDEANPGTVLSQIESATQTPDLFSQEEWEVIRSLSPLPDKPPPNPTNYVADDPNAARLGQKFFFDFRFSKHSTIACSTCHSPFYAFADIESTSFATGRGTRNTPTVLNAAYNTWQLWDGRSETMWTQALFALEGESEMAGTRTQYAHVINEHYKTEYEAVFGRLPELEDITRFPTDGKPGDPAFDGMSEADQIAVNIIFSNIGKAVEAYQRLLITPDAPFDRYIAGDETAISAEAKRGLKVFIGKGGCVDCHNTPRFTDNAFHNIGIPQDGLTEDKGRFQGIPKLLANIFNSAGIYSDSRESSEEMLRLLETKPEDQGAFRTPTLRNFAITAPYFHTGEFPTLESVIAFKNAGGLTNGFPGIGSVPIEPLHLSEQEQSDLIAFLKTLTGELPPAHLLTKPR
ncbi:MAG: cytochrome-c peroxidase [Candidatus Poribacteria bacterium]|nr:cytochrome-c peroxidase [Candidatus Poribacteria bacterium]